MPSDAVILSAEDFAKLKERSEFADELFELTIKLKDEIDTLKAENEQLSQMGMACAATAEFSRQQHEKLKAENETLKAELEVRTKEIDNLKAEIVKSVEEEEQQGEEALVLADNCERLLCAIHGKDYEDAELYSFGAADIIAGDAIEVALKKIEKTNGVLIYQAEHLEKAEVEKKELREWVDRNQDEIDRLRLVIDGHEEDDE